MVEIGGKPIIWHIMKIYYSYGFNEFVILCGYKGYLIKEYFVNYQRHNSDLTIDMTTNKEMHLNNHAEPWKVILIDTGLDSMTGWRIIQAKDFIGNVPFMLTYRDGVADIDIIALIDFHNAHGKAITMTSAQPEGRFGSLSIDESERVVSFKEKPKGDGNWINTGNFVCQPEVFDYIQDGILLFLNMNLWRSLQIMENSIHIKILAFGTYGYTPRQGRTGRPYWNRQSTMD